jgi:glycosyltransferase involved in cell wall biosynthesis
MESELRRIARKLGIEGRVVFGGYRARVGDELAGLDVVLSLSDAEGMPINLIEAGWAGTAVLATAVGGVPELLGTPPCGVLLPPNASVACIADELAELLHDAGRRNHLGRMLAERVASEFSSRAWLAGLRRHYARWLDGTSSTWRASHG